MSACFFFFFFIEYKARDRNKVERDAPGQSVLIQIHPSLFASKENIEQRCTLLSFLKISKRHRTILLPFRAYLIAVGRDKTT